MSVQSFNVIKDRINAATITSKIAVFLLPKNRSVHKRFKYTAEQRFEYFDCVFADTVVSIEYAANKRNPEGGELLGTYSWLNLKEFDEDIARWQIEGGLRNE